MKIVEQLCVKSYKITAQNGDCFEAKQGKYYTTSVPTDDKKEITVFSNFWVQCPKDCFVLKDAHND